ncbi:MFS transporter, partial [Sphingomonas sp. TREG-RG-20F-R18-01]|uniref:MFS transporter n=1 Tax=Sphingomonas sp. TREG-RG-20F-R18-01 TaxID=2914982 RepID=UPI001F562947
MVGLLMVANIFSFVDRQIISLLVDPIREDLGITDVQVSLLIGPAFAVFFCVMALPLGRMVDTRNRIRLAAVGVGLWSLATLLSGFADTFTHLFIARIGVAAGEAALFPAANSLIADSFPPHRRARAIGLFALAIYLGSGFALLFGGAVVGWAESDAIRQAMPGMFAGFASWQLVLLAVGAPGLIVAALIA